MILERLIFDKMPSRSMSGVVFLGTRNLDEIKEFYVSRVGMTVWLKKAECLIFKHGNLLLGFCLRDKADVDGVYTFFYRTRQEVDTMYGNLLDVATSGPDENGTYGIYNFFAQDPEGRKVEFQHFLYDIDPFMDGEESLVTRRSIRKFQDKDAPAQVLTNVFETCRYPPSSHNNQPFYFLTIKDRATVELLAKTRGQSTAPIANAPMAVAICSDPAVSIRHIQDGCIAAYHFILSAWNHGLGTCWMAAMDRDDVKEALGIPKEHYVATVTPVGYPYKIPRAPSRREAYEFIRPCKADERKRD